MQGLPERTTIYRYYEYIRSFLIHTGFSNQSSQKLEIGKDRNFLLFYCRAEIEDVSQRRLS